MKALTLLAFLLGGCDSDILPKVDLERMLDQPRADAYERTPYLPHEQVLQHPPEGTVPAGRDPTLDRWFEEGDAERYVTRTPLQVDAASMAHGRSRFDLFCATCHGIDGSGNSIVAQNMRLRPPPSLVDEPIRAYPAGRVFRVITEGYGLMPSHRSLLPPRSRWAVVSYWRALVRSRSSPLASLPEPLRRRALSVLP